METNSYKQAPTWLFNLDGESALFQTQEEVDDAWEAGWFGPQGLASSSPLLSTLEWETKQDLIDAVDADPRYGGLTLRIREKAETLIELVIDFEEKYDVKVE